MKLAALALLLARCAAAPKPAPAPHALAAVSAPVCDKPDDAVNSASKWYAMGFRCLGESGR